MGASQYWHLRGSPRPSLQAAFLTLQFVFAFIVAAFYGVDLHNASKSHTQAPTPWVYAEVVVCLSVLTCAVHFFVTVKHAVWCIWDFVLFILWVALFGVFGSIYIGGKNTNYETATSSMSRMKVAVWLDLVNMLLWLAAIVQAVTWCCVSRRVKSRTDKEIIEKQNLEGEYHALEIVEAQSSGEVEAGDSKQMEKEEILSEKEHAITLSKLSRLADSSSFSK
ncbi:hypothetical protein N431DRAFT_437659 [Stipitochalara longipes BDJ]|nr:hypothetical protein N431DRAFT_437659 [Stipitochalara longipes BDJ]